MSADSLVCAHCGALLEVSATSFSVACGSCGQWHLIDRSGDSPVATPYVETAEAGTTAGAEPEAAEAESPPTQRDEDVQQLDLDWRHERQKYLVFGLTGQLVEPDVWIGVTVGLVGSALGAFLVLKVSGSAVPGVIIAAAGLAFAVVRWLKAKAYQDAKRRYDRRRRASARPGTG